MPILHSLPFGHLTLNVGAEPIWMCDIIDPAPPGTNVIGKVRLFWSAVHSKWRCEISFGAYPPCLAGEGDTPEAARDAGKTAWNTHFAMMQIANQVI